MTKTKEVDYLEVVKRVHTIFSLLENVGSIKALITWPEFSITSYSMVSGLAKQGVLPRTVLDVGANVGQFAVASAKIFPNVQVYSFEPVPECAIKLRKNVSALGNVTVYPFALGECEGEATFHVNSYSLSSSLLPLAQAHHEAFPEAREINTITVKVSTLDQVFADAEFQPPVLLKLDVQGYEAQVLRGGVNLLKRVDYAVVEASFKPMYEGELLFMDVIRIMEEQQFRFERPVGWCVAPKTGEIIQTDCLFVQAD